MAWGATAVRWLAKPYARVGLETGERDARAIARRDLPNLSHAVDRALDDGDADAVDFVDRVNRFLSALGLTREAARLTGRAEQAGGQRGSQAWYLAQSNCGQ